MKDKTIFFLGLLVFICPFLFSYPIESPTWGFALDLPEGYEYSGGDGRDQFSFEGPGEAKFDLVVYYGAQGRPAPYASVEQMANDIQARLNSSGEIDPFEYRGKDARLISINFSLAGSGPMSGFGLCIELTKPGQAEGASQQTPLLLALAYGPANITALAALHLSALDSLAPEEADRLSPGPITEYAWPREKRVSTQIFGLDLEALVFEGEEEAAQDLIDREFQVLSLYENSPDWQEAWIRYYRAIFRDSFDRLVNIAFQVERNFNVPSRENRDFAEQVLKWVQTFNYERVTTGSDFINLISTATEGRGDCDNMSMLWAIVMIHADIPASMMVSRYYSHAMGLADLPGAGARFEVEGQRLLVAETTADVAIGLIGETVSEVEYWLGIPFER